MKWDLQSVRHSLDADELTKSSLKKKRQRNPTRKDGKTASAGNLAKTTIQSCHDFPENKKLCIDLTADEGRALWKEKQEGLFGFQRICRIITDYGDDSPLTESILTSVVQGKNEPLSTKKIFRAQVWLSRRKAFTWQLNSSSRLTLLRGLK